MFYSESRMDLIQKFIPVLLAVWMGKTSSLPKIHNVLFLVIFFVFTMTTTVNDQMLDDVDVGIDVTKIKTEKKDGDESNLNMENYKIKSNEAEIRRDEQKLEI